jgi:hypothetical protein
MTTLQVQLLGPPFQRWVGPYSPRRGKSGLSLRLDGISSIEPAMSGSGEIGWKLQESSSLERAILAWRRSFGGGRLLFMPTGEILKPLSEEDERNKRVLVGRFSGSPRFVADDSGRSICDLASPDVLRRADAWTGPHAIGLECILKVDGSLHCEWYGPAEEGHIIQRTCILGPSRNRFIGFRMVRPRDSGGRVHLTACGHLYTKWLTGTPQDRVREWRCAYLGKVDVAELDLGPTLADEYYG